MKHLILALVLFGINSVHAEEQPIKILFLGDNGHHKPAERFRQLQPMLARHGVDLVYTDKVEALNAKTLAAYDGLIIYANHTKWSPENEAALIEYVESGKGFIPLHCASACFGDSKKYVDLVGGQFQRHNTGTFRTAIAAPDHPIMNGFKGFESWDETYVHAKHNEKDRAVLEYRAEGTNREPWTWVRTQGKGRVFYTAWGHDERTWGHPGFHNLVERGVRWAIGKDPGVVPAYADQPEMTAKRKDVKAFEYVEANVPFYAPPKGVGKNDRPIRQMQKPLDVAESLKHFVTPVDFEVRPFVTEDKLGGKPIAMTWDERGRLWVAITRDYPNEMQPQGKGRDRIVVCEDSDGDGVCDKVTTFAEGLSIPTSLLMSNGGVIVHQAPHTLFLKDTKGDGKADLRQVLFTGWGTGDTHAGPSSLRYGHDNWIYGMVGYSAFDGIVAGEKVSFRQGLYRFKLERDKDDAQKLKVTKLEFLRNTSNNSWGVGFNEEGLLFGSTANGCPSVFMPIPNRYYERVRGLTPGVLPCIAVDNHIEPITDKVRQVDFHGGFTAAAGHEIYTARTYPKEYWNRVAFVSEPTGHLTAAMALTPNGTTFTARYGWNLLASDDEWSSPIDAQVGPDGHMWVIDWYNFIVQHNPVPPGFKNGSGNAYETELRDKKHGRIYRVVYTKAKPEKQFTLKDATPEQLVAALKHPNMTWRLHAQRLLVERGEKDVVDALLTLAIRREADELGLYPGVVHALETLTGLGSRGSVGLICELGKHRSAGIRRALIDYSGTPFLMAGREPQARLASILSMCEATSEDDDFIEMEVARILGMEDLYDDPNLRDAITMAVAAHPKLLMRANSFGPPALRIVEITAAHAARVKKLNFIFDEDGSFFQQLKSRDPKFKFALLTGAAAGWPADYVPNLTHVHEQAILELLTKLPAESRGPMLKLAKIWKVKGVAEHLAALTKEMFATIADEKATDEQRIVAAKQVIEFRSEADEPAAKLLDVLSSKTSPALLAGIFDALGNSQAPGLGKLVVAKLSDLSPAGGTAALRLLIARPSATQALLDAFERGQLSIGELSLDQKQSLASHSDSKIAARAKMLISKGGGLPNADRQKVIDEMLDITKKKGDPIAGKVVFKNQCAKCHVHGSEGTRIGPDLTGVAVHTKEHLLVDILDPSRSVEGNFRIWKVTTLDGKKYDGLLASETKASIEIVDSEAKKHAIPREDIDELKASTKSLMPEGFEKQVKLQELIDLLEFLTQRGKYLPIPLDKAATVVSTKGMFYSEDSGVERLIFPDWKPKTFDGVPFQLVDPNGDKARNVIMLHSINGKIPPTMPKTVTVPCNSAARAIHLLSGVSGWGAQGKARGGISMIVRLHYDDGKSEDHELRDGEQFADYIGRFDVPGSKFAFAVRGQQVRYLAVTPKREATIKEIEFVKGPDRSAPIVVAVTVETR